MKTWGSRSMRVVMALMVAAALSIGAMGCKTTGETVIASEGVRGNIGVTVDGSMVTILYTGVWNTEDAWVIEQAVVKRKATHLVLHLHNFGGSAFSLFDVCDTLTRLRDSGVHVTTVARGAIASAAVPIFLMGDVRLVSQSTWIMMHPGGWKGQEWRIDKATLRVLEEMELLYAEIVCSRTTFPMDKIRRVLNIGCTEVDENGILLDSNTGQYWMSTAEAMMWGFATGVLVLSKS